MKKTQCEILREMLSEKRDLGNTLDFQNVTKVSLLNKIEIILATLNMSFFLRFFDPTFPN